MVGLLAAFVFQKPVVLSLHTMRLDGLLKALTAATGERYRATPAMAGRIELMVGPPRSAEAIRADLASANWGLWSRDAGGWKLGSDDKGIAARERKGIAARLEAVKKAQAKLRALPVRAFDAAAARLVLTDLERLDAAGKAHSKDEGMILNKVEAALPSRAAIIRLVATIDPTVLAGLPTGRTAFSDRPTRLQRPLGDEAGPIIRDLERDHNVWASVFTDSEAFHEGRNSYYSVDPRANADPIAPGGLRAILVAETQGDGGIRFTGNFYDAAGNAQIYGDLNFEFGRGGAREDAAPKDDPGEPFLPVSAAARAYYASVQGRPNAATRALFLAPQKTEPLDVAVGEGLRAAAKRLNKPITVWIDDALLGTNIEPDKSLSAHGWLRSFWRHDYVVLDGASIVLQPRDDKGNVDRTALADLVRGAGAAGFLPFEAAADFAAAEPSVLGSGAEAVGTALRAVVPGAVKTARPQWDFLRLWGGFAPMQRATLRNNGLVPWNAVFPELKERFVQALLQAGPNDIRADSTKGNVKQREIDQEPSEVLAGDLGMGEGVRGEGYTNDAVFGLDPQNPDYYSGGQASAYQLARATSIRELKPNEDPADGMPKTMPSGYVFGREYSIRLRVPLGPTLRWSKSAYAGEFDLRATPKPLGEMPAAFLKEYREQMDHFRAHPEELGP